MVAEGVIHSRLAPTEVEAVQAWLGPMVDSGFLQHGYLDTAQTRVWLVPSGPDLDGVKQRLDDLPVSREGSLTFSVVPVTGLRFR